MRILTALVVDEIRETEEGRVDLLGLREDLHFDTLPVVLERMTLFLEFEVAPEDINLHPDLRWKKGKPGGFGSSLL